MELANGLPNALVHVEVQTQRHNDLLTTHHQSLMEMRQSAKALNSTQESTQVQTQLMAQRQNADLYQATREGSARDRDLYRSTLNRDQILEKELFTLRKELNDTKEI